MRKLYGVLVLVLAVAALAATAAQASRTKQNVTNLTFATYVWQPTTVAAMKSIVANLSAARAQPLRSASCLARLALPARSSRSRRDRPGSGDLPQE